MMARRRVMMQGTQLYLNPLTGQYYPAILDFTPESNATGQNNLSYRWIRCENLREATIRGYRLVGLTGDGANAFSYCNNLQRLIITDGCTNGDGYIARNCPYLEYIQIGSIGHAAHRLYASAFQGSGGSAPSKTLVVYVTDDETIPVSGAPWGYTGATVIYRSATTGEIRTE